MMQEESEMFAGPDRQRLVVIGNGMVGARFVEELIARGGSDRYDIVMFGDEPTGNYNRILLSGILAGSHDADDTYINPLEWYERNGVTLHAGVRVTEIDHVVFNVTDAEYEQFTQYYVPPSREEGFNVIVHPT